MVDCRSDDIASTAKHLPQLVQETPRQLLIARALDQKDRCKTDVGLIPSCDKGRFFLWQLSVQTLPQPCVQSHASAPVCNHMHQHLCAYCKSQTLQLYHCLHIKILHTPIGKGNAVVIGKGNAAAKATWVPAGDINHVGIYEGRSLFSFNITVDMVDKSMGYNVCTKLLELTFKQAYRPVSFPDSPADGCELVFCLSLIHIWRCRRGP